MLFLKSNGVRLVCGAAVLIRRSLPFDAWPEADRIAWTEAIAEADIFDGRGPAAQWAPTTRFTVRAAYGRYLSFIAAS
jgi:hypothetical protein